MRIHTGENPTDVQNLPSHSSNMLYENPYENSHRRETVVAANHFQSKLTTEQCTSGT